MKTREQLIRYYEVQLEKVMGAYRDRPTDTELMKEKNKMYIDSAKADLEAVKNGRCW